MLHPVLCADGSGSAAACSCLPPALTTLFAQLPVSDSLSTDGLVVDQLVASVQRAQEGAYQMARLEVRGAGGGQGKRGHSIH